MEEFISGSNTANALSIGDRLYDEALYKFFIKSCVDASDELWCDSWRLSCPNAAKILYTSIPNNSKLAQCHVQLGEYTQVAPTECAAARNQSYNGQRLSLSPGKPMQSTLGLERILFVSALYWVPEFL
eukprot:928567-Amphidinium_carterae.1